MLGKQSGVDAGKKQRSQLLCALHISYLIARHAPRPGHAAPGAASADRKIIGFYASTVKMSAHDEKEGTVGAALGGSRGVGVEEVHEWWLVVAFLGGS